MPTYPGRPASAKPGKSSGGWSRATPPARRARDETQSAGYARRRHLWTIADVGSIPTVSTAHRSASITGGASVVRARDGHDLCERSWSARLVSLELGGNFASMGLDPDELFEAELAALTSRASAGEPDQRRPRRRVGGRELDEAQVGMARRRRLQVMEDQAADARVLDGLRAELLVEHLVARPPRAELLAALLERLDEGGEVRVADAAGVLGAEAGEGVAGGLAALLGLEVR